MIVQRVLWQRGGVTLSSTKATCATNYWHRLRGLLGRPAPNLGEALCLQPCSSVHTFFMCYALDIVYLNSEGQVVKVVCNLKPWRISQSLGAYKVYEFSAGEIKRLGLQVGDLCVDAQ